MLLLDNVLKRCVGIKWPIENQRMIFVDFNVFFSLARKTYLVLIMLKIDIDSIIPHREPVKIVSEVLDVQDDSCITTAVVKPTWPLFEGNSVNSLVLVEAAAQTAAIVEGYKRVKQGKNAVKGWLVGIKSAQFNVTNILVNTQLTIFVSSKQSIDNYAVVEGTIKSGENILATMVLQALRLNEEDIK
jgi:predicted hotdog family 3-hydroxylacyl-ACP dehydratase